jgi:predicted nucleotidyltransferase
MGQRASKAWASMEARASGTNRLDSDLDVWISADRLPEERGLARRQRDLSLRAGTEVNLLVITSKIWQS